MMGNPSSPIVKADGVEQKLHSVFFPELLPAVFDDGGHVLDVTFITNKHTRKETLKHSSTYTCAHRHTKETDRCAGESLLGSRC